MKYTKPALTCEEQATLLIERGLEADPARLARKLSSVNYYRLSAYWIPFCEAKDQFRAGTTFNAVWDLYDFDRKLRLRVMDALERIEVAVRTQLAYHFAHRSGPFGYRDEVWPENSCSRRRFFSEIDKQLNNSRETFVDHFKAKYGKQHDYPAIWVTAEILTFGGMVSLFKGAPREVQDEVSNTFGLPSKVMESWLLTLNTIRNTCAHHSRLWNRVIGTAPKLPRGRRYPDWTHEISFPKNRTFAALTMLCHMVHAIMPRSGWAQRIKELINQYPDIDLRAMGVPEKWEEHPVWERML